MTSPLVARAEAAQACIDEFNGKPFEWGKRDCVRMAAFLLRRQGYKPGLARGGAYKTERGARLALARAGFESVEAALDALGLPRIPPAMALPADLVGLPGACGLLALGIPVTNGRLLCVHNGVFAVTQPNYGAEGGEPIAWRVLNWPTR